ncbi:MAG: SGNH/GDSL hydrolase family protein [Planctomycetia bacterium]|nr:SGNH/GDSL hydrolase family protein [Planctomycetia bacterium]
MTSARAAAAARLGRPFWKGLLFRAVAIGLGLLPLVACELTLRAVGIGKPTDFNDPFVGFSDIHPLFVLNEQTGRYEIPKSRQSHFQPDGFSAEKSPDEFRIFVLGGSTVQGRPWSIESSFTTWLELNLNASDAAHRYEVVNCGGVSYATYRLIPILQEVLNYHPDLIVFCEGHNEFLEDRSYAPLKAQGSALVWLEQEASQLRTYNLLREGLRRASSVADSQANLQRTILGPEVDARLDWKGGMAEYHRDEKWQAEVIAHFDYSLQRIVRIAHEARVPLLFVSPVSNLHYAPFKSEHRSDITTAEQEEFDSLMRQASQLYGSDLSRAVELLKRAAAIDDQYAQVHYEIGNCLLELGMMIEARAALIKAKELDVCPLRMLEPMKAIIHRVATDTKTPLVDADALIAAHSRSGIPDQQWLVDHVHPSMSGHQLLADAIAEKLVELGHVRRQAGWETARDKAYRDHLASLDHVYFQRGKDRLRSEQGWAHGLAPAVRAK